MNSFQVEMMAFKNLTCLQQLWISTKWVSCRRMERSFQLEICYERNVNRTKPPTKAACFGRLLFLQKKLLYNADMGAESGKSALPICNYSQILYQFLTFTQNLKRSRFFVQSFDCFTCSFISHFFHCSTHTLYSSPTTGYTRCVT